MEHNYILNPALKILYDFIEPGSVEKEVQKFWENVLWTVFPASDHWMNETKHRTGATEPDNKVMKLVHFNAGWGTVDVLFVELKRLTEKVSKDRFDRVAVDLVDDYMNQSTNPDNTTIFGAVGIGKHVQFYKKVLPNGKLISIHGQPLEMVRDAGSVQAWFDHFKENIPRTQATVSTSPGFANPNPSTTGINPSYPTSFQYVTSTSYASTAGGSSTQPARTGMNAALTDYKYAPVTRYSATTGQSAAPLLNQPGSVNFDEEEEEEGIYDAEDTPMQDALRGLTISLVRV